MTPHARLAVKNLLHARRQTLAVAVLSLCAMLLMLTGTFLGRGLRSGLTAAVEPFDLLVGQGGAYQLVVTTVFLQDYPAGGIPYRLVEELRADSRVAEAIPLAFGDNYRGYRIVGTSAAIFVHRSHAHDREPWLRFAEGRAFAPGGRGAVVGATAARELGLRLGDALVSSHGLTPTAANSEHAHEPYTVCGILDRCDGPYDRAIFVDLADIWAAHGIHAEHDDDHNIADEAAHEEPHAAADRRLASAIMVKPAGYADAYGLFTEFNGRGEAEMIFPAQTVVRLLSMLGHAEWLFQALGVAAGLIAACTVALAFYWSAASRERETTILRLLGARRRDVLLVMLFEGIFAMLPGLIAGDALGRVLLRLVAGAIERGTAIAAGISFDWSEPALCAVLLAAGLVGSALAARRVCVVAA